jgi:hypothetical protein
VVSAIAVSAAAAAATASGTKLPRPVRDALRQRGVTTGRVLLLAAGEAHFATKLAGQLDCAAVVLTVATVPRLDLQLLLTTLGARLSAGTLLVLQIPHATLAATPAVPGQDRRAADPREIAHLLLLRSGYDQVWAHQHGSTLCLSARRAAASAVRTCSIVVPVFNEKETFPELMRGLLGKRLDHLGLQREIILVESNSTDGTRDQVAAFATTPGVKILWQGRPRGKGHAVREGFAAATGDIVLIQDADLEYDLDDYDVLLEPLLRDEAAFVLGSRHSGRVRMRQFTNQRLLGTVLDTAHLFFTGLINGLYGQNMKDPFTMFKVFRRDCLFGLDFECNRFDFDHELLIKLVLKGYRPLEIPVNYRSRSFKQGKKIRFFRDPPTWIAADLKYRLRPLRPKF